MKDKSHILSKTKYRPFPSVLFFLDTETKMKQAGHKTKLHELRLGYCARYDTIRGTTLQFDSETFIYHKEKFISWLDGQLEQKKHYYIIAHNVVYDATILDLFRLLPSIGFTLQSLYSKGQVCLIRWKRNNTKITLMDNGNIFSGTLEKWGDIFKIPKIKIDFDTCTKTELETYCKRDVDIMVRSWQVWIDFITQNDCGGFRETVGSTAFNTWRYKYMPQGVYVHKDKNALALERASYHGGRVEAFHQGDLWTDHYYYLDINNMYGFIMLNSSFPTGLQGYTNKLSIRRMINYLERYSVIARVTVNVDQPAFIASVNGHAAYPLGRFETTLTSNEIRMALSNGWLEELHEFSWYENKPLFESYVNDFYNLRMSYREAGNKGFEAICKLLINSLYGKFGQTGIEQRVIGKSNPDEIWHMPVINAQTGKRSYQTSLGGVIFEEFHEGESHHAIPAIAAHVTADARLYLFSLIQKAGFENVFYCDTDSLIINRMGYYNLESEIQPDVLGKLKIETQSNWLRVNAPKDYEMSERKKIKGIRNNAIPLDDNTFIQEQWVKLAGLINQGFELGYTSKEITKHQQRIIHSGTVTMTGKIEPFVLR